ncbi:hypothetical protein FGO68_gene14660 [Halteria grandinella]|uniref:Uncharacterized protein n=1 Tax=Halteria grandinella TaxID=5974 RepID=A0A8J8NG24_HALGN|nr:hypothetical protein FGO68_gene14660 [Halteria grandinella]
MQQVLLLFIQVHTTLAFTVNTTFFTSIETFTVFLLTLTFLTKTFYFFCGISLYLIPCLIDQFFVFFIIATIKTFTSFTTKFALLKTLTIELQTLCFLTNTSLLKLRKK